MTFEPEKLTEITNEISRIINHPAFHDEKTMPQINLILHAQARLSALQFNLIQMYHDAMLEYRDARNNVIAREAGVARDVLSKSSELKATALDNYRRLKEKIDMMEFWQDEETLKPYKSIIEKTIGAVEIFIQQTLSGLRKQAERELNIKQ